MHLKLSELQHVVKATMKEERAMKVLREEVVKVLGPTIDVPGNEAFAERANELIDVLETTRRLPEQRVKLSALLEIANNKSEQVRKLAVRLLPNKLAEKFIQDPSSSVRCAAAKKLSYKLVRESLKKYPNDDQLRTIARQKRLKEEGLPKPKVEEEDFDMYGDGPLGDAVKQNPGEEMPDSWYDRLAKKLCKEYGTNIEGQWEEILATRIASSTYATSGVKLDRDKLLKAIYTCLEEREDAILGEGSLRSIVRKLRESSVLEETVAMPILEEEQLDPIVKLNESKLSSAEFVIEAEKLFNVKKSTVPAGIRKYRLGEGYNFETQIPVLARLPVGHSMTHSVERALDLYVEHWNKKQSLEGEPYLLKWFPHPTSSSVIGFNLELR